jgi:MerR family mercuric resistance operon transcriptional regulator
MMATDAPERGMTIGRLAEAAGVHVETVRYYQRIGLFPEPARAYGSARRYGPADAAHLRFIKRAQGLGFALDEVRLLLQLAVGEHCAETRTLAERNLALVEEKLRDLTAIRRALRGLVRACGAGVPGCGCPIIDRLAGEGRSSMPARQTSASRRDRSS